MLAAQKFTSDEAATSTTAFYAGFKDAIGSTLSGESIYGGMVHPIGVRCLSSPLDPGAPTFSFEYPTPSTAMRAKRAVTSLLSELNPILGAAELVEGSVAAISFKDGTDRKVFSCNTDDINSLMTSIANEMIKLPYCAKIDAWTTQGGAIGDHVSLFMQTANDNSLFVKPASMLDGSGLNMKPGPNFRLNGSIIPTVVSPGMTIGKDVLCRNTTILTSFGTFQMTDMSGLGYIDSGEPGSTIQGTGTIVPDELCTAVLNTGGSATVLAMVGDRGMVPVYTVSISDGNVVFADPVTD